MPNPTLQTIVDETRESLNDDDKTFWKDTEDMLPFAREGLGAMINVRPDLLSGQFGTFVLNDVTLATVFPFEEQFVSALKDYLVFRANRKQGEWADNPHSKASFQFFKDYLM